MPRRAKRNHNIPKHLSLLSPSDQSWWINSFLPCIVLKEVPAVYVGIFNSNEVAILMTLIRGIVVTSEEVEDMHLSGATINLVPYKVRVVLSEYSRRPGRYTVSTSRLESDQPSPRPQPAQH